jgi:hypothetical protein
MIIYFHTLTYHHVMLINEVERQFNLYFELYLSILISRKTESSAGLWFITLSTLQRVVAKL